MSRLEEWRQKKASIETPTTSTFPILEILNPFTFWFRLYAIDYLESCFDHLITLFSDLNRLTVGAKTYSILLVTVSSGLENEGSMNLWFFERYSMYQTYTQIMEHHEGGHEFIPQDCSVSLNHM
jgi:hypothetical protein